LVAIGAILTFAITVQHSHGFNINTIGIILMVVGAIWAIAEIAFGYLRRRTEVVQNVGPTGRRTTYSEPNQPY
jgi:predicted MFS family arabinose efflux permease